MIVVAMMIAFFLTSMIAYEHGWQSRNHKAIISTDITDRYIIRRRVLVFTIS
jgi:hypothetical protein